MSLMASCMLNGSPGPRPGAPLKSPMVSVTWPKAEAKVQWCKVKSWAQVLVLGLRAPPAETEPEPEARLMRLKRLNMSARSWTVNRSVMGTFLYTDRSTDLKLGPTNLFLETFP